MYNVFEVIGPSGLSLKPAIQDVAWWINYEQVFSKASIARIGPLGN